MAGVNHKPFKIRIINQLFQELFPSPLIAPPAETAMRIFPVSIVWRQIAPRRTCAQYPENSIEKPTVIPGKTAPLAQLSRKVGRKQFPSMIAQIVTVVGSWLITHQNSFAHFLIS